MIRARAGPSKATPSTTCQKCLKKDDYECTSTTQERPYKPRPSRTQQLLNPKLVPKLNSDVPNDLLRKKGIADEQLAKIEQERGRDGDHSLSASPTRPSRKRSRSLSSSGSSVSTISTNLSRSASPTLRRANTDDYDKMLFSQHESQIPRISRKRQRSSSPDSSEGSYTRRQHTSGPGSYHDDRNTRRRRSSISPDARGRRSRHEHERPRRRDRSRDSSMNRSQIARNRYSLTPERTQGRDRRRDEEGATRNGDDRRNDYASRRDDDHRYEPRSRRTQPLQEGGFGRARRATPPVRERSLSPYSKRMALTQAIGTGR